jgi:ribosomal protein S18 acetylase RimI-like enzyme
MDIEYRSSSRSPEEFQFVAEIDSRIPIEYDPHFQWVEANIQKRISDYHLLKKTDFFHVAILNKEIIGFHIIKENDYLNHTMGNVVSLWVAPNHRRKGIAKKLKELGEEWGKKRKVKFIQTAVHFNNTAMNEMNKKMGYEKTYELLRKYF